MLFKKRFSVYPNQVGYLFRKNKLKQKLAAGMYEVFDWNRYYSLVTIPTSMNLLNVTNQDVLTKDNIALRFSFAVEYHIENTDQFIQQFDIFQAYFHAIAQANQIVHSYCQIHIRDEIGKITSEELNEKKTELLRQIPELLQTELMAYGIAVKKLLLKDITFPKAIQNLFAKKLEATIRAEADLKNARSTVAAARALKNASDLMKDDQNIKFIQLMETMTKIATKGNHTFVLSDFIDRLKKT